MEIGTNANVHPESLFQHTKCPPREKLFGHLQESQVPTSCCQMLLSVG